MTKLRLVLLATTAFGVTQIAATASFASQADAPILLAQAAPPAAEGEPKKGPPREAPRHEAPKTAPPAAPHPPAATPPSAPRPTPPAAAPHPTPPAAAPAHPAPQAAPPARPAPPAAAPTPRAEPPARPERREAPAGQRPGGAERREPGARPAAPTPPAAQPPASPATPPAARQAPATPPSPAAPPAAAPAKPPAAAPAPAAPTPPAGAPPSGRPGGPQDGRRPGGPGAPTAAPGTPPNAAAPGAAPPAAQPGAAAPATPPVAPGAIGRPVQAPGSNAKVINAPPPQVNAPLPPPPASAAVTPIAPGAAPQGPRRMDDFRGQRTERQEGGRTVITEPGRVIVRDPGGQSFIRHNEVDRFRYGARDIRTDRVGGDDRTIVMRPDGSQIVTLVGRDGQLLRRTRRDRDGREIVIIDNSFRGPRGPGGFFVDLPPPVIRIPQDRYIVDYDQASPDLVYDTLIAPPVDRIERRYTLDEIRYSPMVRQRMPSIDLDTINFDTGSWDIPPDQASKLKVIADGLNRAISRNPRSVFLIEGHTDAVGSDVDNLSLSDRRAESAAELLTQQFQVPAENLTSQGYGEQYLKIQTDGPERRNRRVTIRNITPLLNGGQASLPPPPPGTAPPR